MKISVIVPIFNAEKYLCNCIDSILKQTFNDFELILIDDGSTDGSGNICDKYACIDKRIVVYHTPNNGRSSARNLGIENATADYISFVDADDWVDEDFLESLHKFTHNGQNNIVISNYTKENSLHSICNFTESKRINSIRLSKREALSMLSTNRIDSYLWNKLFKRELFNGIEFPIGRNYEDIFVLHRIFSNCDSYIKISYSGYHYYLNPTSITSTKSIENYVDFIDSYIDRFQFLCPVISKNDKGTLIRFALREYFNLSMLVNPRNIAKKQYMIIRYFIRKNRITISLKLRIKLFTSYHMYKLFKKIYGGGVILFNSYFSSRLPYLEVKFI